MQLLHNLYQVGGDMNGVTWAGVDAGYEDGNSYVLATPEGLILFDCGCGDTLDQIFDNMRYWRLEPSEIKVCFLTHAHIDHAGAAHLINEKGISIYAHANTVEAVATGDERCCGFLYHKIFRPCKVDHALNDGDVADVCGVSIEVMHVPGHSMGCTAYLFNHEDKRVVVSGDLIGTLLAGDFGWSGSIDFDREIYLQSLQRFAKVDSDIMLPGHGMVYFHKPRRRVEQVLNSALREWRQ
ncbi:MBL fold metallo-hydrolase [bacterium AH-315-P07]|nr:MBL fold metallo-hydrolase [bacterium AH-315-P07]